MGSTIVALSDTHYAAEPCGPRRRGEIADMLLRRAVHRINHVLKPDVVVLLGDLVNDGDAADAPDRLRRLRAALGGLECPSIVLPGNHDGDPDAFYRVFARPPEVLDLGGVRFLPFLDPEEPGYNGRRTPADLARAAGARGEFSGPVVALQHLSVFPPGLHDCPYNLVNGAEALAALRAGGVTLTIGGHFHPGIDLIRHEAGHFVVTPALCEMPFAFLEITLADEEVRVTRHALSRLSTTRSAGCG